MIRSWKRPPSPVPRRRDRQEPWDASRRWPVCRGGIMEAARGMARFLRRRGHESGERNSERNPRVTATTSDIEKAAGVLRAGGLVTLPTETVYGLGANAEDPVA